MAQTTRPKLFIASSSESLRVAQILQQDLSPDVSVTIWNQGAFNLGEYTLDDLLEATKKFDFGVFVIGADDTIEIRGERVPVGRDNVIFELGLFIGKLGKKRSFLVVQKTAQKMHLPSDLHGVNTTQFIWDQNIPFSRAPLQDLHSCIGPSATAIMQAIDKVGVKNQVPRSLSGGMIYLALCLSKQHYSFEDLVDKLVDFETHIGSLKAPGKDKSVWRKLTKYACQCLEANEITYTFGGNEWKLTDLGKKIIFSSEVKLEFENVFTVHDSLNKNA